MLHLQGFRNCHFTAVIAQWLVALFFLQGLLPVQAHSRIDTNDQGVPVVICTLEGHKTIFIDFDDDLASQQQTSVSMLFSDLLNDLTPVRALAKPPAVVLGRSQSVQGEFLHVANQAGIDPISRAPPRY
jgi:hypothetical protein